MRHGFQGGHRIDATVLLLQTGQLEHFLGCEHDLRFLDRGVCQWRELAHRVGDFGVRHRRLDHGCGGLKLFLGRLLLYSLINIGLMRKSWHEIRAEGRGADLRSRGGG